VSDPLSFYNVEIEIKPCPKCGKAPLPIESGPVTSFEAHIICVGCGTHTKTYGQAKVPWSSPEDADTNDEIRRHVCQQAIEAWNAGKFVVTVEDIHLDTFALGVLGEMIQDYLETQAGLSPAERVKGWDTLKRKWRECGRLVRKEVEA